MEHLKFSTDRLTSLRCQTSTNASNSLSSTHSSNNYSESALITNEHSLLFQASTDTSLHYSSNLHHSSNSEEVDPEMIEAASILVSLRQNQSSLSHNPLEDSRQEGTTDINISGFNKPPRMDTKNIFLENPRKRKKPISAKEPLTRRARRTRQSTVSQSIIMLVDHTQPAVSVCRSDKTSNQRTAVSLPRKNMFFSMNFQKNLENILDKIPSKKIPFAPPGTETVPCLEHPVCQEYCNLSPSQRKILTMMDNKVLTCKDMFSLYHSEGINSTSIPDRFRNLWVSGLIESLDSHQEKKVKVIEELQLLEFRKWTHNISGNIISIRCFNSSFTSEDIKQFTEWYQKAKITSKIFMRELIENIVVSTKNFHSQLDIKTNRKDIRQILFSYMKKFICRIKIKSIHDKYSFFIYVVNPSFADRVKEVPPWDQNISQASAAIKNSVTSRNTNKFAIQWNNNMLQLFFLNGIYEYFPDAAYVKIPFPDWEKLQRSSTQSIRTSSSIVPRNNKTNSTSSSTITDKEMIFPPLQDDFKPLKTDRKSGDEKISLRENFKRSLPHIPTKNIKVSDKDGWPDLENTFYAKYASLTVVARQIALILNGAKSCNADSLIDLCNVKKVLHFNYQRILDRVKELRTAGLIDIETRGSTTEVTLVEGLNKLNLETFTYGSGDIKSVYFSPSLTSKDREVFARSYHEAKEVLKKFIIYLIENIVVSVDSFCTQYYAKKGSYKSVSSNLAAQIKNFLKANKKGIRMITIGYSNRHSGSDKIYVVNSCWAKCIQADPPWTKDMSKDFTGTVNAGTSKNTNTNTNKFVINVLSDNREELIFLDGDQYYESSFYYEKVSVEIFEKLQKWDRSLGNQD